jgi:hypothetical protein
VLVEDVAREPFPTFMTRELFGPLEDVFEVALANRAGRILERKILSAVNSQEPAGLALVGSTIYPAPDGAPVRNAVVLDEGGRITAVGPRRAIEVPSVRD